MNNILWKPDPLRAKKSKMALFIEYVNKNYTLSISNYSDLYNWSISDLALFWDSVSQFFKIKYFTESNQIIEKTDKIYNTKWFEGARLNYTENMFKAGQLENIAIEFFNELLSNFG